MVEMVIIVIGITYNTCTYMLTYAQKNLTWANYKLLGNLGPASVVLV